MTTIYPNAIDGYEQIRFVSDRDTSYKIDARDHNDLRSSIISIESTIGINPQGVFGTVCERLLSGDQDISLHASGSVPRHIDEDIDAALKTGSPNTIASGTVKSQVQQALDYINDFHAITGAALVGATGFTTAKNNYTFSSNNVQGQIQEAGNFMDLNIDYLRKAFNSYIVEGLSIYVKSISNLVIDVEAGSIASQGMLLQYPGAEDLTILTSPGSGTFYIYASRTLDTVTINAISSSGIIGVLNNIDTIVVLAEISINGSEYVYTDMRRFGVFSNDKNCFTVGNTPTSGNDGYGCDFISLKAAVKTVSLFKETGNLLGPSKIMLVSNITINDVGEAEILLPENTEIDGAGNTIYYSAFSSLFLIESDNVTIRDLNVVTDYSSNDWSANGYFISAAQSYNISNLKVIDCTIASDGANDLNAFIYLCGSGSVQIVNGLIVRNNNVAVYMGGVYHLPSISAISLINNAIIEGNIIYQNTFIVAAYSGIVVGSNSKVINNFVRGGFATGIWVSEAVYSDVQGNTLIGEDSATAYMGNGIIFSNRNDVVSDNIVSNNIIRGITTYGINCKGGDGSIKAVSIDNNIIDNSFSASPPINMRAINSYYLTETTVSNNMILYPGAADGIHAINEATQVIGNYIYCVPASFGVATSFLVYVVKPGVVISQNVFKNTTGVCIYVGSGCHGTIVSNNTIYETYPSGANCIATYDSNYLTITNNTIVGSYSSAANRDGIYLENCNKASLSRNSINNIEGVAIYTNGDCTDNIISNNIMTNVLNGINCGTNSSGYFIKDNFIIYDSTIGITIAPEDGIVGVGSNSIIDGNYIYNFGQGASNYAISCSGDDAISIINNVVIGAVGYESSGINCPLSLRSKVSGNYLRDVYSGIVMGQSAEICNNRIYNSSSYGINVMSNSNVVGNYIFNCITSGITTTEDSISINGNYIYMTGPSSVGISLSTSNYTSLTNNYINARGVASSGDIRLLYSVNSYYTSICSNYFVNFYTMTGADSSYGIYLDDAHYSVVDSNYFYGLGITNSFNMYSIDSRYSKITNNYMFGAGTYALTVTATSTTGGRGYIISGNYIYSSHAAIANGIIVSSAYMNNLNLSGNYVYLFSTTTGTTGITLGDTTGRAVLLSSNIIRIGASATNRAVTFTSSAGMKVIGNIAIGGVAPDGTIWNGGYVNSADDNVFTS